MADADPTPHAGMLCRSCGADFSRLRVTNTVKPPGMTDEVRRRRRCLDCGECWWTVEVDEDQYRGRKEAR